MKLSLKNIGKVRSATIEINGITVIAGENDTGKSTISRALFAVFNSFYKADLRIQDERSASIGNAVDRLCLTSVGVPMAAEDIEKIVEDIITEKESLVSSPGALREIIIKEIIKFDAGFAQHQDRNELEAAMQKIIDVLRLSDQDILRAFLARNLNEEFNFQITNLFSSEPGEIQLEIQEKPIIIHIKDDRVVDLKGQINLRKEAVYIDDPFVLDETGSYHPFFTTASFIHRKHLMETLRRRKETGIIDEIIVNKKFDCIYSKITSVCDGDIISRGKDSFGYRKAGTDKILDVKNLSAGLKTFAILKTLLQNGTIEQNGTIILDEPEIHLHPEWQLLCAELIVLIHYEFGIHVLLNTHSPYFLNAIEVYAAKYQVADQCKYYLTQSEGDSVRIEDVTTNVESIYRKLAAPLQTLENERYRYDESE